MGHYRCLYDWLCTVSRIIRWDNMYIAEGPFELNSRPLKASELLELGVRGGNLHSQVEECEGKTWLKVVMETRKLAYGEAKAAENRVGGVEY